MPREKTTQVAFRLADTLLARLDAHVERMTAAAPGIEYTRVDAVRALLDAGLSIAEAAATKPSRKAKR